MSEPPLETLIEISSIWDDSLAWAGLRYGGLMGVTLAVVKFIRWKQAGPAVPCPFTADKKSGIRGDGTTFPKYKHLGLRHCHLDLDGTDPLLAYRELDGGRRILMLCVTDHREMFAGEHAERAFHSRVKSHHRGKRVAV